MLFNEAELDLIKTRVPDEGEDDAETTAQAEAMTEWAEYAIDQLPKHCDDLLTAKAALARVWYDQKVKDAAKRKKLDGGYMMDAVNQLAGNMRALSPLVSETINTHSPREEVTYHAPIVVKKEEGHVVRIYSQKEER